MTVREMATRQRRPTRRRRGLALVVLLLVGIGAAGGWWWWHSGDTHPDPATVALPAGPSDATAVSDFLIGPGASLVTLVEVTADLAADASTEECVGSATLLDPLGAPAALADLATSIPDPDTADAAGNLVVATGRYIAACGTGDDLSAPAEDVAFARTVFARILERAGVR